MSYIDDLKELGAIDFSCNDIKINSISVFKISKTFKIDITINKTISLSEYKKFYEQNSKIFEKRGYKVIISNINYLNFTLSEEEVLEYFNYYLEKKILTSPFFGPIKDFKKKCDFNQITFYVDENIESHKSLVSEIIDEIYKNHFVKFETLFEISEY